MNRQGLFSLTLMLSWLVLACGFRCQSAPASSNADFSIPDSSKHSARDYLDFDANWRFSKGDSVTAMMPDFDDASWRQVDVPHDWSSEGPFGPEYASGTGFAPGGIAWYRKHFHLDPVNSNKWIAVEFDGVYDHAEVWINGHFVGRRPYGYSSFEVVLSPLLKFGKAENVLAVRVDHSRFADSRWYTGSGIYRHVRLRLTDKLRIGHWGVFVTTPEVTTDAAAVQVQTILRNDSGIARDYSLESEIFAPDGQAVGGRSTRGNLADSANEPLTQRVKLAKPQLWSPDKPVLYTLKSRLRVGPDVVDDASTSFGIRTLRFDPDHGFFLNGVPMKFKGVCLHHDAGALGAAVPAQVWERRLRTLKEIGVNAIRTSHNPPAPEFLDLCDRLGFLVKDEAFDEFTPAKNKWRAGWNSDLPSHFGYAESFERWSVTDAQDMVRRDRNHPSVIMWSIGNEIDYANDPFSHPVLGNNYRPAHPPATNMVRYAEPLIAAVKQFDTTRPVTMALANVPMSDAVGLGELLDIVGYNYQEQRYAEDHARYPDRFIFGSETSHRYSSWTAARDNDYVGGQFLWTGIDYLGEARRWPNRASGSGMLDLCGFKKPLAWFRQSLWSDQPMVYLCAMVGGEGRWRRRGGELREHWNWPSNSNVRVVCYATCPEVTLFLNDRALGTQRLAAANQGALIWDVPFEPGTLKGVGKRDGREFEFALRTAGEASRVDLIPSADTLDAEGRGIVHVEFQVVDAQGTRIPDASTEVTFSVEGPAELLCIENGDRNSPNTGKGPSRQAYRGRGLAIIRSSGVPGPIRIRATASGLRPAHLTLNSR